MDLIGVESEPVEINERAMKRIGGSPRKLERFDAQ